MFSSQDIITGEKLQHIADICFLDTYNPNYKKFSKNFHFVNIPYPQNKVSALNGKVLYFPTHLIDYFFSSPALPDPGYHFIKWRLVSPVRSKTEPKPCAEKLVG